MFGEIFFVSDNLIVCRVYNHRGRLASYDVYAQFD